MLINKEFLLKKEKKVELSSPLFNFGKSLIALLIEMYLLTFFKGNLFFKFNLLPINMTLFLICGTP